MCQTTLIRFGLASLLLAANWARADIYVVNSTQDLPDGDGADNVCATLPPPAPVCTLRAAVMQANAHGGADYIYLPAGTYVLTRVGYDVTASLGDLDVTDDLTIQATGGQAIIDANGAVTFDRAFEVAGGSLALIGITIKNGNSPSYGGAIYASGKLTLTNVSILDSSAGLDGGGIYAKGADVQLVSSTLQGNITQGKGGGIAVRNNGSTLPTVSVTGSSISGNQSMGSFGSGGGIFADAVNLQIQGTFVQDNTAVYQGGGASYTAGYGGLKLQVADSVFDHNMTSASGFGGGLYSQANDTIQNTQFTNNAAASGGGIYAYLGSLTLTDVAVSANTASDDGAGIQLSGSLLDMLRCRVDGNIAGQFGGGIAASGKVTVTDSVVFGNRAADGGGVYASAQFTAISSAIYRNYASHDGGGVFAGGTPVVIDNSTMDGNSAASNGGGVFADSMATVKFDSATITGNYARVGYPSPGSGGGVYVTAPASATAASSVFAYNTNSTFAISPNDCSGTLTLSGYSFVGSNSDCSVMVQGGALGNRIGGAFPNNINPLLSEFERLYAQAPQTPPTASPKFGRVPLAGSPLLDAASPGGCQAADGSYLLWDEIGQFKAFNGRCDIGAVEFGALLDEIFAGTFEN